MATYSSHTGDGMVRRFRLGSQSAVEAAMAAQRGLELPVRMGIASGEVGSSVTATTSARL